MISEAVGYLKGSEDAAGTVIIGGILSLFAFLIVPLFAVAGYLVHVLDRTASGDDEAPVFDDWGELIVEGAKPSLIAFVYALVPMAVFLAFAVGGGISVRPAATPSERSAGSASSWGCCSGSR